MTRLRGLLAALFVALLAVVARAHEVQPCYLELSETSAGVYDVTWKAPRRRMLHLRVRPILPANASVSASLFAPIPRQSWIHVFSRCSRLKATNGVRPAFRWTSSRVRKI